MCANLSVYRLIEINHVFCKCFCFRIFFVNPDISYEIPFHCCPVRKVPVNRQDLSCYTKTVKMAESGQAKSHPCISTLYDPIHCLSPTYTLINHIKVKPYLKFYTTKLHLLFLCENFQKFLNTFSSKSQLQKIPGQKFLFEY